MALHLPSAGGDASEDDAVLSTINTTPLVDVMLVLLIIFLITVPVVVQTAALSLPKETNAPRQTQPQNVEISVTRDGGVFWNTQLLQGEAALAKRLKDMAAQVPQPEVHIRGDEQARYEWIGRVLIACQSAGIRKVSFVTEPLARL